MSALARITEKDEKYVAEFSLFLVDMVGAKATADALVFELPEGSDAAERFHGLELVDQAAKPFEEEFADVCTWLREYKGSFSFYVSLKAQLAAKGKLSPKQIDSVLKAIERDRAYTEAKANAPAPEYSLKPGEIIVVGKWLAKQIAEKAGYTRPHHTFEAVEVEAETAKAFKLKVKLSAQKTVYCGVCGITLTNPESIALGIGPICAEKSGVGYQAGALDSLAEKLRVTAIVSTWLPKQAIKSQDSKEGKLNDD